MAKRIVLVCDVHVDDEEHEATQTLILKLGSAVSEVDACDVAVKELREDWLPIMRRGRFKDARPKSPKRTTPKTAPVTVDAPKATIDAAQAKHMREWAEKNNVPYNKRGRLGQSTIDAYQTFHRK